VRPFYFPLITTIFDKLLEKFCSLGLLMVFLALVSSEVGHGFVLADLFLRLLMSEVALPWPG
jgi:hypothetical protein